jgi:hypothetical protein
MNMAVQSRVGGSTGDPFQCAFLVLAMLIPAVAPAQFTTWTENGSVTITGYTDTVSTVTIPSTIGNLPVTVIATQAFYDNTNVTSITIPGSVSNIQDYAFYGCDNLASITFTGNGLASIGNYSFAFLDSLSSFTLPSTVNSMGQYTFYNSYSLTDFTIQGGATTLGPYALCNCFELENLEIPSTTTAIGNDAFLGCYGLAGIIVDTGNPNYTSVNGVLFNKNLTTLILYPPAGLATSYSISNGVTELADGAFQGNDSLTNITVPDTVTKIGSYAFVGDIFTGICLPDCITCIGDSAFAGSAITRMRLPRELIEVGNYEFYNCASLSDVEIPSRVTTIGSDAFAFCPSLVDIYIPGTVTNIGEQAFYDSGVASVTIGQGVQTIGLEAFYDCSALNHIAIPSSVTTLGNDAFAYCPALTAVYFGGNVPAGTSSAFDDDTATFYYLPGTTGWGSLSGFQTELWNVKIIHDSNFGLRGGEFGFDISGNNNLSFSVEASTSLSAPQWRQVSTLTLSGASTYFTDPDWKLYSNRFYRVNFP